MDYETDTQGQVSGFGPVGVYAQWGDSGSGTGVVGTSANALGILGESRNGTGVIGRGAVAGVVGNGSQWGVQGNGRPGGTGVEGFSDAGIGVRGVSGGENGAIGYNFGVVGMGPNAGVVAFNQKNNHAAYLASEFWAAWFTGHVHVGGRMRTTGAVYVSDSLTATGDVYVGGTLIATHKKFQIDHPLDPDGKYLVHSSVESSEMKNIYDGVSVLDSAGEAEVVLPAWLDALNTNFRYQLTPIGGSCPNLFIAEEVSDNRFKIGGGVFQMKVSWQVTGIRKDSWAVAHPLHVELQKSPKEREFFLHPEFYGADQAERM